MIDIRSSSGGNAIHASTTRWSQRSERPAEVRGQQADDRREHAAEQHRAEPDVERDARAVHEAREQIAPELIGAEPVRGVHGDEALPQARLREPVGRQQLGEEGARP
jgi:hypothetical protein